MTTMNYSNPYMLWEFPKIGANNSTLHSRILMIKTPIKAPIAGDGVPCQRLL